MRIWKRSRRVDNSNKLVRPGKLPRLIAHRGGNKIAPENTLAAMRAAKASGITAVELDVQPSRDGTPFVIHDDTLNRTTSGTGLVQRLTDDDLMGLDAGSWFDPRFSNERVPKLTDMLDLLVELKLGLNLEIKSVQSTNVFWLQKITQAIEQHWLNKTDATLLISSFSLKLLKAYQQYDPDQPLGILVDSWYCSLLKFVFFRAKKIGCVSVHVAHQLLTQSRVAYLKRRFEYVVAYTVNEQERARVLIGWGVDSIISDSTDFKLR